VCQLPAVAAEVDALRAQSRFQTTVEQCRTTGRSLKNISIVQAPSSDIVQAAQAATHLPVRSDASRRQPDIPHTTARLFPPEMLASAPRYLLDACPAAEGTCS